MTRCGSMDFRAGHVCPSKDSMPYGSSSMRRRSLSAHTLSRAARRFSDCTEPVGFWKVGVV